jgi:phosphodiesterase/alkaline phosphatase D-like protein
MSRHATPPRHVLLTVASLSVTVAAFLVMATPAIAAFTHIYTGTSFGPDGTSATSFENAQGLAVDQSTGDLYVYDAGAGKVYKFDSSGHPLNFSALGTNAIENIGGGGRGELEIAVAPAGSPAGTSGDIYVANNNVVKIYSPSGAQLPSELTGGEVCGVATNPAGHVFVSSYPRTIKEYTPAANPPTNSEETAVSVAPLQGTCNIAVDGLGNVYAAIYYGGGVTKLEGLTAPSGSPFDPSAITLAADPSNNDVYADRGSVIVEYAPSGAQIGTFSSPGLSRSYGVAPDASGGPHNGYVYVVNSETNQVEVFGPLVIIPNVSAEPASDVGQTAMTLNGHVDPVGGGEVTGCRFEYVTDAAFQATGFEDLSSGGAIPCEQTLPISAPSSVSARVSGLSTETTYHFRLIASNANGPNVSESQEVTLHAVPDLTTEPATGITQNLATLNASFHGTGEDTHYYFQWGLTNEYGNSTSAPPGEDAKSPTEPTTVSASVAGLEAATTYHYRVIASNSTGETIGQDSTFTTPFPLPPRIEGTFSTQITPNTATLLAQVNPGFGPTAVRFQYGTSEEYGLRTYPTESIGSDGVDHTASTELSGLEPATIYHYRAIASNLAGTAYGADQTFATPDLPAISGSAAADLTETSAVLSAMISPGFRPTTYHFEYGRTEDYGQKTPESPSIGSDDSSHPASATLSGLAPAAIYHFRVVASNEIGTADGPDQTFTTLPAHQLPPPPPVKCKTGFVRRKASCVRAHHRRRKHRRGAHR